MVEVYSGRESYSDAGITKGVELHTVEGFDIKQHDGMLMQRLNSDDGISSTPSSYSSTDENKNSILKNVAGAVLINASTVNAFSNNVNIATTGHNLGRILAWGCTIVYCSSRCPQLYKNYKRKSVDGISPLLFGSALLGNLTYTLSILTSCSFVLSENRSSFLLEELPYILGSSGTIIFDAAYFYQKHLYKDSGINTSTTIPEPSIKPHTFTPSIRHDPFNSTINPLNLPLNTKPHPLSQMKLETISNLSRKELIHLNQISYGDVAEKAELCFKLSNLFTTLPDSKQISWIYNSIKDEEMKNVLSKNIYEKSCALNFLIDPTNHITHSEFIKSIISILNDEKSEKSARLLSLFSNIANTEMINSKPILLNTSIFKNLLSIIEEKYHSSLFSYMIHINFRPKSSKMFTKFKNQLLKGSEISKFVALTGYINPKWLDLNKTEFNPIHSQRIIDSFTMRELKQSTDYFISTNEPAKSSLFLNFMILKLEKISNLKPVVEEIQLILKTIIKLVMKFKDTFNGIEILKHMLKENIKIEFDLYLSIFRHLRSNNQYDEFITLLNEIELNKLSKFEKQLMVNEIILLIKAKFPTSPKVMFGYIGALFKNGLKKLNDLGILSFTYESTIASTISSTDVVQIANIDADLKCNKLNSDNLAQVYDVLFNSIPEIDAATIMQYYKKFIPCEEFQSSDAIITIFLNHLLYDEFGDKKYLTRMLVNYQYAKQIFNDYMQKNLKKIASKNLELLVEIALKNFNDFEFATQVLQQSDTVTSKQIFLFFEKFKKDGDELRSKIWLDQLKSVGLGKTNSSRKISNALDSKDAYIYKWNLTKKKRQDKLAIMKLNKDNLMLNNVNEIGV
ncbi:uncharacterized protein KGF55_004288 [Candida pseudojiufengensis]|uniref:uncharacterized protein n=1 Tax=Candida pseudojiufengensis TaxID=497109 RepID=UPI002225AB8D|nr:uncharacterized protein KGF55_004288 [Candida pseudojiufengensis]KAI5961021.1 hypothetical protein KGF55_004288 [Candida pseudojiufengensis]